MKSFPEVKIINGTSYADYLDRRIARYTKEYIASLPFFQFEDQVKELIDRWSYDHSPSSDIRRMPKNINVYQLAVETVKERWVDQGIWDETWKDEGVWYWKHDIMRRSFVDLRPRTSAPFIQLLNVRAWRAEDLYQTFNLSERRPPPDNYAARPIHQFLYQMSLERAYILSHGDNLEYIRYALGVYCTKDVERIGQQIKSDPRIKCLPFDNKNDPYGEDYIRENANSVAYEVTKAIWKSRGIWDDHAGMMPGNSWQHEREYSSLILDICAPNKSWGDLEYPETSAMYEMVSRTIGPALVDTREDDTAVPQSALSGIKLGITRSQLRRDILAASATPQFSTNMWTENKINALDEMRLSIFN